MGWLDAWTGAASKNAANATTAGLNQANTMTHWGGNEARGQYGNAISFLQDQYGEAAKAYQPMTEMGLGGAKAYQSAVGLGPEGAAGFDAFRNTPGYEFARDEGLQAVMRNAAARGGLAGGNTTADMMKYGTGLADQTYGNYLSRLNPLMAMYGQGVTGQANALTGMGTAVGNMYGRMGDSYMDEARNRANLQAQIGQAQAGGIMGAANAQAGVLNQGLNLAGSLFGMPGSVAGTSMGGDLFKRYVQGAVPAQWG
jgi:hypothetical protein